MALALVVTNAGRAALLNAQQDGTRAVRVAACGVSPTAIVAGPTTAALPGEVKRIATLSGLAAAADVIHMLVRDETRDSYTVRSIALYLSDGTLFAVYGQPDPILEKSAQAILLMPIDVKLADIAADRITFGDAVFVSPPATREMRGIVELATDAEAEAATDGERALTPANIGAILSAARILARLLTVDGAGSGLDADMLDGRHGAEFAALAGAAFTGRVSFGDANFASYFSGANPLQLWADNDYVLFDRAANAWSWNIAGQGVAAIGPAGMTILGTAAWYAGNDGAGSGLDADMLDGLQATDLVRRAGDILAGDFQFDGTGRTFYANNIGSVSSSAPMRFLHNASWFWQRTDGVQLLSLTPAGVLGAAAGITSGGPIQRSGNIVWDAGNDGAGSGLDADMLDGRQGAELAALAGAAFTGRVSFGDANFASYFSGANPLQLWADNDYVLFDRAANAWSWNIAGQGVAAIGPAGMTILGTAAWYAGNDGAGSGLDADLLDGQQGGWYADVPARLGFAPLPSTSYTAADVLAKLAAVDGAGSGLDADLLDGWHRDDLRAWANLTGRPESFPAAAHTHGAADIAGAFASRSFGTDGYQLLPGGLILQWVAGAADPARTERSQAITFPLAFPNACLQAFPSTRISQQTISGDALYQIIGAPGPNGCTVLRQITGSTDDNASTTPLIFAIGF